jgi:hypothetical protein
MLGLDHFRHLCDFFLRCGARLQAVDLGVQGHDGLDDRGDHWDGVVAEAEGE